MVSSSVCERVLSRALSRGGTFAEIFIEDSRNFSMSLRDGRIENAALSRPYGAGVRVYDGLRSIYVYTCDVSETGLLRAADRAAAAVTDTPKAAGDVRLAERAHPDIHPVKTPFLSVEAARRADVLRQADQAARAVSPSIVQVSAGLISREQHVLIANSEGLYTGDTRVYTRLLCSAVASDGRENQTGTRNPGAMMGFELFDGRVDPAQTGREAAQAAATMLTAPYCAAGEMPVSSRAASAASSSTRPAATRWKPPASRRERPFLRASWGSKSPRPASPPSTTAPCPTSGAAKTSTTRARRLSVWC